MGGAPAETTIEGYLDRTSYTAGDAIAFHVSTTAPLYDIRILRETMGKRVLVASLDDLPGEFHPTPKTDGWREVAGGADHDGRRGVDHWKLSLATPLVFV
jgi:hypothetical protein